MVALCAGTGLVAIPHRLFVGSAPAHLRYLERKYEQKQAAWRGATDEYYRRWEAAEALRLRLEPSDPHRALMAALTYDEFALARYVGRHAVGRSRGDTTGDIDPKRLSMTVSSEDVEAAATGASVTPTRARGVTCNLRRLSALEAAVDAQTRAGEKATAAEERTAALREELSGLRNRTKDEGGMSAAEAAARARQIQAELEALKAAAEEEAKGHAMVWKTHKNLANHRVALERAKHEMEQLSEDIVDIELALDTAHSRTEGQYAQWRCRRATAGVLACLASLAVFFSAALGTHSSRRWASPVGLFVLLDGEAGALWRLVASALALGYMGVATYSTLFRLRYRLLLVYPLRFEHNSLPLSVQTLATYMLALLNPLGLWFTRMVVDPSALITNATETGGVSSAEAEQMAYSQVYTHVQTVDVLQDDQFWGGFAIGLTVVVALRLYRTMRTVAQSRDDAAVDDGGSVAQYWEDEGGLLAAP